MNDTPPDAPLDTSPEPQANQARRSLLKWLWRAPVLAVIAGGVYGLYEVYKTQFSKLKPSTLPDFERGERVEVSALSTFQNVWDSAEFVYGSTPAVVMRLPEPVPGGITIYKQHYAAFSRICTHQGCLVRLSKNPELIAVSYNYRSPEPALACNCHFSVFVPTKAGQVVSGPATKPLPRIKLEADLRTLYATGIEDIS